MRASRLLFAALACALAAAVQAGPDLVLTDANVLTQDPSRPRASALAVRDGRILAVGTEAEVLALAGQDRRVLALDGATVLPGLVDTHAHPVSSSVQMDDCSLEDKPAAVPAIAAVAARCLRESPLAPGAWLVINNLNPAGFGADHRVLDAVVADRPLALLGSDGHTAWVNTRGLALTGITRATPEPEHGAITRDADGDPTGHFVDGGQRRLHELLPEDSVEDKVEATARAFALMQAAGITTVMDASVNPNELEVYRRLGTAGRLVPRVSVALEADVERGEQSLREMVDWRARYAGVPRLTVRTVKIFADGVLEYPTQSAALIDPYLEADGRPGDRRGRLYVDPAAFGPFLVRAAEEGFDVHVHAIGDAAVRATLDAFAAARASDAGRRAILSASHLQLIHPDDRKRFGQLGVFASFQLLWAQPNAYSVEAVEPWIGAARMAWQYPAADVLAGGGTVAGGSDWNVSAFEPFRAIQVGHTRRNPDEPGRAPLAPEQALPVEALLRAYTLDAARMLGMDAEIGSLSPGKAADLVVLDRDPLDPAADLWNTGVRGTLIDGRWVYRAAGFEG